MIADYSFPLFAQNYSPLESIYLLIFNNVDVNLRSNSFSDIVGGQHRLISIYSHPKYKLLIEWGKFEYFSNIDIIFLTAYQIKELFIIHT